MSTPGTPGARVLFDFARPQAVQAWHAIDDRVMGGVSQSCLRHHPAGHAVFEGELSLLRNGGFVSVRSSPAPRGEAGAQACWIEVRGEPRQYKLSLFTDDGFDSLGYQCGFAPAGPAWQGLRLPLDDFCPRFRGREVAGAPALHPARIRQVGLVMAERQAGAFRLDIRLISLV